MRETLTDFQPVLPRVTQGKDPQIALYLEDEVTSVAVIGAKFFFNYLNTTVKKGHHLWVMTYTTTPNHGCVVPVSRMIYAQGNPNADTSRRLINNHTKLYLVMNSHDEVQAAYLGSLNFVAPNLLDLMVAVPKTDYPFLKQYFLSLWKQAK